MMVIRRREITARLVIKYLLFQLPELMLLALLLFGLRSIIDVNALVLWSVLAVWVFKDLVLFPFVAPAYREGDRSPLDITGDKGVARGRIALSGTVFVRGTLWTARQQEGQRVIEDGEAIRIVRSDGLTLWVTADQSGPKHDGT